MLGDPEDPGDPGDPISLLGDLEDPTLGSPSRCLYKSSLLCRRGSLRGYPAAYCVVHLEVEGEMESKMGCEMDNEMSWAAKTGLTNSLF